MPLTAAHEETKAYQEKVEKGKITSPRGGGLFLLVLEGTLLLVYLKRDNCFFSISFSFFSWYLTYSLICFSFNPTVLTQ